MCTCRGRALGTTLTRRALTASARRSVAESARPQRPAPRMAKRRVSRRPPVAHRARARWFRLGDDGRHSTESVRRAASSERFANSSGRATRSIAERIRLEGVIRDASSRARLQPIAEQRLNMHIPKPDQQVILNPVRKRRRAARHMIRSSRIGLAHAMLALFAIAILVKAAQRPARSTGRSGARCAERQQMTARTVPAPRGEILDATRRVLAQSREMVRLEIAPREVRERAKLRRALASVARRPVADRARARYDRRSISRFPAAFSTTDAAPAMALRGVHVVRDAHARVRGVAERAGNRRPRRRATTTPVDGLELSLDSILRGIPGAATIVQRLEGTEPRVADRAGHAADEGQQRRAHDQRRSAGDRREGAGRRRVAHGRRGRRHRHSRSARRRDSRDGEPPTRSARDVGDGAHRAVRARVDGEAVHGGGSARARARVRCTIRSTRATASTRSTAA